MIKTHGKYRNLDLSGEEASAARRELYRLVRNGTPLYSLDQ